MSARFKVLRPALEPLFNNAIAATDRLYDQSAKKEGDEVIFLAEISHIYAGAILEVTAAFFRRMATWSNKTAGLKHNYGFEVNGVGLSVAALAGSNNHKHWQEWTTCQQTGKQFKQNQLDSMEPLARVFYNDPNIRFTDDSSARVLKIYSEGSYDVFEQRVLEALALLARR